MVETCEVHIGLPFIIKHVVSGPKTSACARLGRPTEASSCEKSYNLN